MNFHQNATDTHQTLDKTAWIDEPLPDTRADEQQMDATRLAKFRDILRFSSEYWGGAASLWLMLLLMVVLIAVVADEKVYQAARQYVVQTDAALFHRHWYSALKRLAIPLAVGVVIFGGYLALRRFSRLGRDRVEAWGLAFLILVLSVVSVKMLVELIDWRGSFWESVKNKETSKFIPDLVVFCKLAFTWIFSYVYSNFFSQLLQIRWRTWLTEKYSSRYLLQNRFYQLEQIHRQDNPDQRIADDLDRFTSLAVSLFFGLFLAALSVYEFSKSMLKLSGNLDTHWFGHHVYIPDYMFWTVIVYTIIGSIVVHYIGRRLVRINVLQQQFNANFRYHLIRAREYAEGIAFLQGDAHHLRAARHFFTTIRANWYQFMSRTKYLGFAQYIYAQAAVPFPIIVAAPRYFAGTATFGSIMAVISAFNSLSDSLSWFINNYSVLAELRASATRIFNLDRDLQRVDAAHAQSQLNTVENNVGGIALTHTYLTHPKESAAVDEQVIQVADLDWQVSKGERWLVTGASGSGKSTILRAIAGLWYFGRGHIDVPTRGKTVFLPQKPYMPIGTLREALAYPDAPECYNDAAYAHALELARLEHLKNRLDEINNWAWLLSGGEQQRVSFARLFLQRPSYAFLDEATSALDEVNEQALYQTLLEFLPDITLVSVSHHEALGKYHQRRLHLQADAGGGFRAVSSEI